MIRFTTTESYSLVMDAFSPSAHIPIVDEIGIFENRAGSWSGYIHGNAETLAGFDIPEFISGILPDEEGEFPAKLVLPDREVDCIIIQWRPNKSHWKYRALICSVDDIPAIIDARNKAERFANTL